MREEGAAHSPTYLSPNHQTFVCCGLAACVYMTSVPFVVRCACVSFMVSVHPTVSVLVARFRDRVVFVLFVGLCVAT